MRRISKILWLILLIYTSGRAQIPIWFMEKPRYAFERLYGPGLEKIRTIDRGFDVQYYHLNIAIFPDEERFRGTVTVRQTIRTDGLKHLVIDAYNNLTILSAFVRHQSVTFRHDENILTIPLPDSVQAGDTITVQIDYAGIPAAIGGFESISFSTHEGYPVISTLSEPFGAPAWWPCRDNPADKADSMDITVTVPSNLIVASNGKLLTVTDNGDETHTYHWQVRYSIATYLVSLAVSNYVTWSDYYHYAPDDSMIIRYYAYLEHEKQAREDFRVTPDMISFYSSVFGPYPFLREKYGMAVFPWGGAMEHQTCTSYGAGLIRGNHVYDRVIAHELAHQWFGDLITMRYWSHIWLNEGFATYAEALWIEHLFGKEGYSNYMTALDPGFFPTSVYVRDSTDISELFSQTVYHKGAWVLHMLRYVMGDTAFFQSLRDYRTQFAYGNACTEDFRKVCEKHYHTSLDWFFDQWVYRKYRPKYLYTFYEKIVKNQRLLYVTLEQTQSGGELFKMPLDIRIQTASSETTCVVRNDQLFQQYEFPIDDVVFDVTIDPDNWVLKYIHHEAFPEVSMLNQNYPNPFKERTAIPYHLARTGDVDISIYNLIGQKIITLVKGRQQKDFYTIEWNGNDMNHQNVSSGVYICAFCFNNELITSLKLVKLD